MLCYLNSGPLQVRVFGSNHPWLGEDLRHEGIDVHIDDTRDSTFSGNHQL